MWLFNLFWLFVLFYVSIVKTMRDKCVLPGRQGRYNLFLSLIQLESLDVSYKNHERWKEEDGSAQDLGI